MNDDDLQTLPYNHLADIYCDDTVRTSRRLRACALYVDRTSERDAQSEVFLLEDAADRLDELCAKIDAANDALNSGSGVYRP